MSFLLLLPGAARRHIDLIHETILSSPYKDWKAQGIEVTLTNEQHAAFVLDGTLFKNQGKWYCQVQSGWVYAIPAPYQDDALDTEADVKDQDGDFK